VKQKPLFNASCAARRHCPTVTARGHVGPFPRAATGARDVIKMTSIDGFDLYEMLGGFNNSDQILSMLCSADGNSTSVQRHDRPSHGGAARVQLIRIVVDLYVVGLICLVGFIGEWTRSDLELELEVK